MRHLKSNNFLLFSYLYFLFGFMQIKHIEKQRVCVDEEKEQADAVWSGIENRRRNGREKIKSFDSR